MRVGCEVGGCGSTPLKQRRCLRHCVLFFLTVSLPGPFMGSSQVASGICTPPPPKAAVALMSLFCCPSLVWPAAVSFATGCLPVQCASSTLSIYIYLLPKALHFLEAAHCDVQHITLYHCRESHYQHLTDKVHAAAPAYCTVHRLARCFRARAFVQTYVGGQVYTGVALKTPVLVLTLFQVVSRAWDYVGMAAPVGSNVRQRPSGRLDVPIIGYAFLLLQLSSFARPGILGEQACGHHQQKSSHA